MLFSFSSGHVFVFSCLLSLFFFFLSFFFLTRKAILVHIPFVILTTLSGRDHLQPLPDNRSHLTPKPKLFLEAPRVIPAAMTPTERPWRASLWLPLTVRMW